MAWKIDRCTECGGKLEVNGPNAVCSCCGTKFFDPDRVPAPEPGFQGWLEQGIIYPVVTSCSRVQPKIVRFGDTFALGIS